MGFLDGYQEVFSTTNPNAAEVKGGGGARFFFPSGFGKKIITNSYFIFFLMFICQNVGNLKGFLLVYLHGYQVTAPPAEAPHIRTIKIKK